MFQLVMATVGQNIKQILCCKINILAQDIAAVRSAPAEV